MPNRDVYNNKVSTIRDWSGGWNISDSDHNLSSKYQPVSDNVVVMPDGSIQPRYGYRLFKDLKFGRTKTAITNQSVTFTTTLGQPAVKINWTGHGLTNGMHITIDSLSGVVPNFPVQLSGVYGVLVLDANTIQINMRNNATGPAGSTTSAAFTFSGSKDNYLLGGDIIDCTFFQGYWILFDNTGEVAAVDNKGNALAIYNNYIQYYFTGTPVAWRKDATEQPLKYVSFDSFKQTLIAVNGRDKDKPLEINFARTTSKGQWVTGTAYNQYDTVVIPSGLTYRATANHTAGATFQADLDAGRWVPHIAYLLLDPANGSNAAIPRGEFVMASSGYVLIFGSDNGSTSTPTTLDISASGTSSVFQSSANPGDAVQIELGRVTNTMDPRITGCGVLRNFVYVAFYDTSMLGKLGEQATVGTASVHKPDFNDQIPQHGALNHRVIQTVGNDLFMCDFSGVPAFSQSLQTGVIVPDRISQLVDPALSKHLARLSATTLRYYCWSMFNVKDRQYMLFVPKHDSNSVFTIVNSIYTADDLSKNKQVLVNAVNHTIAEGDYITVSGAVDMVGLTAANINGVRRVSRIIDDNYFVMEVGAAPNVNGVAGGGTVLFTPINDETIGYVYCYNPQLRIRRWTRFRALPFTNGATSVEGQVLVCTGSKLYFLGTTDKPIYADGIGDYDYDTYTARAYVANDRVRDSDGTIWNCITGYVATNPSFSAERANNVGKWEVFVGKAVNWVTETPWSDMGDRLAVKRNNTVTFDTHGSGRFKMSVFGDNIYKDPLSGVLSPMVSENFVANDGPGFGTGSQPFGGGRRVREQFNYLLPFVAKLAKMRFEGASREKMGIVTVALTYIKGSSYR